MEIHEIIFGVGNMLFLIASYPMISKALKNKASLKGFSFFGSLLTSLGMATMIIGFVYINVYTSAIIAIPTLLYWVIVTYYNRRML